ncbi:MAG: hypothetical protein ACE5QV_04645, partial [Fidelibacterota bacterium]
MNDKINKICIAALFCILYLSLSGKILYAGGGAGYAAPHLRLGLGARAIGMGNAFTAVVDDGFSIYYNPAGLPWLEKRHLSITYSFLSLDRKFGFIGYAQRIKPGAGFALGWVHAGTDNIDGRDFNGRHTEFYSESFNTFYFSFSINFLKQFSAGIN